MYCSRYLGIYNYSQRKQKLPKCQPVWEKKGHKGYGKRQSLGLERKRFACLGLMVVDAIHMEITIIVQDSKKPYHRVRRRYQEFMAFQNRIRDCCMKERTVSGDWCLYFVRRYQQDTAWNTKETSEHRCGLENSSSYAYRSGDCYSDNNVALV